jgi:hypothetical protein
MPTGQKAGLRNLCFNAIVQESATQTMRVAVFFRQTHQVTSLQHMCMIQTAWRLLYHAAAAYSSNKGLA